ncbi:MAG TPA: protein translocase SEC61 complex subunit gamma [Candidatus Nanoarchaeia archaeon]|nr:protein translocase SEC61 complex subunit gamma [Candidatus Nanoarchaeia archaeon]
MDENQPTIPSAPQDIANVGQVPPQQPVRQEIPQRLVNEAKTVGSPVPGRMDKLHAFIQECKRVLRVTKKPNKEEFMTIVKISAAGMAIIGVLGFLIHLVKELLI